MSIYGFSCDPDDGRLGGCGADVTFEVAELAVGYATCCPNCGKEFFGTFDRERRRRPKTSPTSDNRRPANFCPACSADVTQPERLCSRHEKLLDRLSAMSGRTVTCRWPQCDKRAFSPDVLCPKHKKQWPHPGFPEAD